MAARCLCSGRAAPPPPSHPPPRRDPPPEPRGVRLRAAAADQGAAPDRGSRSNVALPSFVSSRRSLQQQLSLLPPHSRLARAPLPARAPPWRLAGPERAERRGDAANRAAPLRGGGAASVRQSMCVPRRGGGGRGLRARLRVIGLAARRAAADWAGYMQRPRGLARVGCLRRRGRATARLLSDVVGN